MSAKSVYAISFAVFVLGALLGVAGTSSYLTMTREAASPHGGTACTSEAKLCPDGTSVGRSGPNCEFAECPGGDIPNILPRNESDIIPEEHGTTTTPSATGGSVASSSEMTVVCTMDVKICPDGSSVSRTVPSCEFAPCPGAKSPL